MGRRYSVNHNLPPRMRARKRGKATYYTYDHGGRPRRETPLGTDYILAVQKWSAMHQQETTVKPTVAWAIAKYLDSPQFDEVSLGTQADYRYALTKLLSKFGDAPLDQVRPSHITLYLDIRSKESRSRALREKAVLSMVFSWCMARDYCTSNPVSAIMTKRLPGRKHIVITDDMLDAVYAKGSDALKEAIDVAYYLGQRPADVLKLSETDVRNGFIELVQNKTKHPLAIRANTDLESLLQRINTRKSAFAIRPLQLLVDERGKPMTKAKLRSRFDAARTAAGITGEQFQFRDLRRKAGQDLRRQMGLDAAQDLLGHANQSMTEHYTAAAPREVSAIPRKRSNGKGSG